MDHPCTITPDLPECLELAQKLAPNTTTIETLKANAPAVLERLDAAIAHIGTWVEAGEAFAGEQVPLLVKEIIWWGVAEQAFPTIVGLCLFFLSLYCWRKTMTCTNKWQNLHTERMTLLRDNGERPDTTVYEVIRFAFPILGTIFGGVGLLVFMCNVMYMVKPLVAPRLYLIEYFQHLVR